MGTTDKQSRSMSITSRISVNALALVIVLSASSCTTVPSERNNVFVRVANNSEVELKNVVRLAMSYIEGTPQPEKGPAIPLDEPSIRHRLKALSQEITSNHADLLELLVRFDDLEGWKSTGASHCAEQSILSSIIPNDERWEIRWFTPTSKVAKALAS